MSTHPDFEELLRLLEEGHVDYMIVGGYAVAYHGHPRFTKDIDVFYHSTDENVDRLRKALIGFGFPVHVDKGDVEKLLQAWPSEGGIGEL